MKAVILAAGTGSRIRPVSNDRPKCLLQFEGRAILDYQLDSLVRAGVSAVAIAVGYGKEQIVEHVARRHPDKSGFISFVFNPLFAATNNIYSLWLARDWIGGGGFLCLNADVLYHPAILPPAVGTQADISMIIDPDFREETMKVIIRGEQVLVMRKGIGRRDASGTYIGITTFSRRVCHQFFGAIKALLAEGRVNDFFNVAVERLIARGIAVGFTETGGLPWAEVDDAEDFRFAQTEVAPRLAADPPGRPIPARILTPGAALAAMHPA